MVLKHFHEPRKDVALRNAWRQSDPAIERDAELFWRSQGLLPESEDVGERLKDLCLAGYDGDALVGLSTARVRYIPFLGAKLAMLRVAVMPEMRRNRLATYLQAESRERLEQWSVGNPAEEIMGVATIDQSRELAGRDPPRAYQPGSHLNFIGWTANGEIMRVAWFDHATIPVKKPDAPPTVGSSP